MEEIKQIWINDFIESNTITKKLLNQESDKPIHLLRLKVRIDNALYLLCANKFTLMQIKNAIEEHFEKKNNRLSEYL